MWVEVSRENFNWLNGNPNGGHLEWHPSYTEWENSYAKNAFKSYLFWNKIICRLTFQMEHSDRHFPRLKTSQTPRLFLFSFLRRWLVMGSYQHTHWTCIGRIRCLRQRESRTRPTRESINGGTETEKRLYPNVCRSCRSRWRVVGVVALAPTQHYSPETMFSCATGNTCATGKLICYYLG